MDIIIRGSLPVYSRAELSRTVFIVAARFLTAISTSVARHFRAADTQNNDYPTVQALQYMGWLIAERSGGRHREPFDAAMSGSTRPKAAGDRGADRTNSQGGVSC
jgi:hypothetical protein